MRGNKVVQFREKVAGPKGCLLSLLSPITMLGGGESETRNAILFYLGVFLLCASVLMLQNRSDTDSVRRRLLSSGFLSKSTAISG